MRSLTEVNRQGRQNGTDRQDMEIWKELEGWSMRSRADTCSSSREAS